MEVVAKYYSLVQQYLTLQSYQQQPESPTTITSSDSIASWSSDNNLETPTSLPACPSSSIMASDSESPPKLIADLIETEEGARVGRGSGTSDSKPLLNLLGLTPPSFSFSSPISSNTRPNNFLPTSTSLFHHGVLPSGPSFFPPPTPVDDPRNRETIPVLAPNRAYSRSNLAKKKEYICRFCQRVFSRKWNLEMHEQTHTDEKPYTCDVCGRRFRRSDHLRDHRCLHSDVKPFTCDICTKGFYAVQALRRHRVGHFKRIA